jgi:16S rRNA C967 or C1407 C5-methylase (RsmB/RsmF family)/NOL1/NOP2/fmu family ribosome biogenesis protein
LNLPHGFLTQITKQLGSSLPEFELALLQPSPISVRYNPKKKLDSLLGVPIPWAKEGRYLDERPVFTLDPSFHSGAYYVQEASSLFLEQALKQSVDLSQPLKVLDLCAAPGGKSTHILSLINSESLLVSNEVIRSRASILSENIQKWGHHNILVTNNDPAHFKNLHGFFDVIVLDAPCSGEGLFRKDKNAMNEWSLSNVALCSQRQQRIIADIWRSLKQNGILIYSTCTYNEKENEDNLVWLERNNACEFVSLAIKPDWGIEESKKERAIGYRFYPHKVKGEGFYLSVARKTDPTIPTKIKSKPILTPAPKKFTERLNDWVSNFDDKEFIVLNELICMISKSHFANLEMLTNQLHTVLKGTAIATPKHEKLIPEHSFALSTELNQGMFPQLELTKEEALSYLRKENLEVGVGQKGFCLMTYQGIPLGWVNLLGNRLNNLYPANWRVRMADKIE